MDRTDRPSRPYTTGLLPRPSSITIGYKKTKEYIAGELRTYIEAIGLNNVTQTYSDNASAMLGALDDLVATYPYLYKQGCCAHILDLLLGDWGKEEMSRP
jgi:hypothetical protein